MQSLNSFTSDRPYYHGKLPSASQRALASYRGLFTRRKNRSLRLSGGEGSAECEVGILQGKLVYQVI